MFFFSSVAPRLRVGGRVPGLSVIAVNGNKKIEMISHTRRVRGAYIFYLNATVHRAPPSPLLSHLFAFSAMRYTFLINRGGKSKIKRQRYIETVYSI